MVSSACAAVSSPQQLLTGGLALRSSAGASAKASPCRLSSWRRIILLTAALWPLLQLAFIPSASSYRIFKKKPKTVSEQELISSSDISCEDYNENMDPESTQACWSRCGMGCDDSVISFTKISEYHFEPTGQKKRCKIGVTDAFRTLCRIAEGGATPEVQEEKMARYPDLMGLVNPGLAPAAYPPPPQPQYPPQYPPPYPQPPPPGYPQLPPGQQLPPGYPQPPAGQPPGGQPQLPPGPPGPTNQNARSFVANFFTVASLYWIIPLFVFSVIVCLVPAVFLLWVVANNSWSSSAELMTVHLSFLGSSAFLSSLSCGFCGGTH